MFRGGPPPPPPSRPPPPPGDHMDDDDLPPPSDDDEDEPPPPSDEEDDDLPPPDEDEEDDPPPPSDDDEGSDLPPPSDESDEPPPPDDDEGSDLPPPSPDELASVDPTESDPPSPESAPPDSPLGSDDDEGPPPSDEPSDVDDEPSLPMSEPDDEPDALPSDDEMSEPPLSDDMTPASDLSGDFDDEPLSDPDEEPDDEPDDELSDPPDEFPDEVSEFDDAGPELGRKSSKFKLPVKAATIVKTSGTGADDLSSSQSGHPTSIHAQLDSLGSGLRIKKPPKIMGDKSSHDAEASAMEASEEEKDGTSSVSNSYLSSLRNPAEVRKQALEEGFTPAHAKFEGDDFELVFVKVEPEKSQTLYVRVATGPQADFDLSSHAYVFEDPDDSTRLILEFHKSIIVFKFDDTETALQIMKDLPSQVFMSAELTEEEERLLRGEFAPEQKQITKPKMPPATKTAASTSKYGDAHVKGTSVEDILEDEFGGMQASSVENNENLDKLFFQGHIGNLGMDSYMVAPQRRKELVESHIRRPQYSVRRVTLLCEWINSLHIWPNTLDINSLHKEICNGLLLARIVKTINPSARFVNLNEKALAKKAALENLEQALGNIWRSKSLNNSRIPSALDIYTGNTSKTAILLNELFGIYVQRPLYKNAIKILKWYHVVLKQYSRPLPASVFEEGDLSGLWPHFQSGTALFCIVYHFFGPTLIGEGVNTIRIDPIRVAGYPTSICDFRSNLLYTFQLLEALNIDVIWTPEDWISNPDTEFIMLQLSYIYEALKYRQGALPPAQGTQAGMTSGPNGEPLVVGMIFSDTRPPHARIQQLRRRAVLLGHDNDSMPLLPVDRDGKTGRFISSVCPLGMVSNNAQLTQIHVDLKERNIHSSRDGWDISASTGAADRLSPTVGVLNLLREHNKRDENTEQSTFTSLASVPITEMVPVMGPGTLAAGKLVSLDKTGQHSSPDRTATFGGGKAYSAAKKKAMTPSKSSNATDDTSKERPASQSSLTIQTGAAPQNTAEIDQAIKALEREMKNSDIQLNGLEEELASRYIDLENRADNMLLDEYEAILDSLEVERRELEDERAKLQEHFTRKLESIKELHREVQYKTQAENSTPYGNLSSSKSQQIASSANSVTSRDTVRSKQTPKKKKQGSPLHGGSPGKTYNKTGVPESKKTQAAEKGWISSCRNDTHNYTLRNRQQASAAALQTSWTPRMLKKKEKQRVEDERAKALAQSDMPPHLREIGMLLSSPTSRGAAAGDGPTVASVAAQLATARAARTMRTKGQQVDQLTEEEQVELSFSKFKYRLHFASVKWLQAKQQTGRARLMDMINSNTFVPKVELISLPEKSLIDSGDAILSPEAEEEMRRLSYAIREDESARMIYEDERRRMVMSEQALLQSYELTEHIWTAAAAAAEQRGSYDDRNDENYNSSNPVTPNQRGDEDGDYYRDDSSAQQVYYSEGVGNFSPDAGMQSQQMYDMNGQFNEDQQQLLYDSPRASSAIQKAESPGSAATSGPMFMQRVKPSSEEVESAFRWLSTPRSLVMADRTPKEYTFIVVDSTLVGSDNDSGAYSSGIETSRAAHRRNDQPHSYTLQWRDEIQLGDVEQEFVMGHIHVLDMKDIIQSKEHTDSFTILVGNSTKALRNSKGRTSCTIQCNSPGECGKYIAMLHCIRRSYE